MTPLSPSIKVDMAILLTPSDDVKAYWRALNYRGSIVVVDSPECGPLMRAHKVCGVSHTWPPLLPP